MEVDPHATVLANEKSDTRAWIKLLRIHQWSKNALVFVPLVTAQRFDLLALGEAVAAFLAFSLTASAIYILNDLVDLSADGSTSAKNTARSR